MRSGLYVVPGQTRVNCQGCHDPRYTAPAVGSSEPTAFRRTPSTITADSAPGSRPLSFPRLIQPILDSKCISCHSGSQVPDLRKGTIDAGTVAEIDPSNGSIPRRFTTGRKPVGVAVVSGKLVVSDFGLNQVTVVDLTTGSILGDVAVNNYPLFVEGTTNGTYAIVGHATPSGNAMTAGFAPSVTFIDVNARTVAANIPLPAGSTNVRKIKCSPDGQWAYVVHTLGRVTLPTTQITKGWVNTDALTIINVSTRSIYTTVLLDTLYEGAADSVGSGNFLRQQYF